METKEEGVFAVYKGKELIAFIKRDDLSSKHLIYLAKEATSIEIAELITNNK